MRDNFIVECFLELSKLIELYSQRKSKILYPILFSKQTNNNLFLNNFRTSSYGSSSSPEAESQNQSQKLKSVELQDSLV